MNNKVAIINSVIDYGSTGVLVRKLFEYGKSHGYNPYVFYGRGKKIEEDNIIKIDSRIEIYFHKIMTLISGRQGFFSNKATNKLLHYIKEQHISKVILLNLHGYYLNEKKLLKYLKENKIQTAYITPDEYAGLGKCCYSRECEKYKTECRNCPHIKDYPKSLFFDRSFEIFSMKKEIYNGFDTLTLIGPETNLIKFKESALVKDKPMKRASWGIDLDLYKYELNRNLYDKYKIPKDKIIILTVAKFSDERKGVKKYFFELAKRFSNKGYHFINIGYDGNLKTEDIPNNMTTIGYINNQKELANLYALSDLYLLASTSDTMPISCLISFACETPVCCFYTSGLKYLADRKNPAIHYSDEISVDSLEKIINQIDRKDRGTMRACRILAEKEYSVESFNKKVYEVFD